jgi:hypothetical protein
MRSLEPSSVKIEIFKVEQNILLNEELWMRKQCGEGVVEI